MENNFYIWGFFISFLVSFFSILIMLGTGSGKEALIRWWNRFRYKRGGYVNGLKFYKDGNIKEVFVKKKEDNSVYIGNEMHSVNPVLLRSYKHMPTQVYLEGNIAPVDMFKEHLDLQSISDEEVNKIILSQSNGLNMFKWIANNLMFFWILIGIIVILLGAILYYVYTVHDLILLKDTITGGAGVVRDVVTNNVSGVQSR